jgi:hypothetical protein
MTSSALIFVPLYIMFAIFCLLYRLIFLSLAFWIWLACALGWTIDLFDGASGVWTVIYFVSLLWWYWAFLDIQTCKFYQIFLNDCYSLKKIVFCSHPSLLPSPSGTTALSISGKLTSLHSFLLVCSFSFFFPHFCFILLLFLI